MMNRLFRVFVLLLVGLGGVSQAQLCATYKKDYGPFRYLSSEDTTGHFSGWHQFIDVQGSHCTYYQSGAYPGPCTALNIMYSTSTVGEVGDVGLGFMHETASDDADGAATATAPNSATSTSEGVGAVKKCLVIGCSFSVSLPVAGGGVGYSSTPVWSKRHPYTNTCLAKNSYKAAVCDGTVKDTGTGDINPCGPSPILIDTKHEGWHITDPNKKDEYVTFNFGGKLIKVAWPDYHYHNAWLVLPKKGIVNSADDMFGEYTYFANCGDPSHNDPNGVCALQWWDLKAQGGNTDGVLDKKDAIWKKLRVWIPTHCHLNPDQPCVALDSELHNLDSVGVHRISLVYADGSDWVDPTGAGTVCDVKTMINPDDGERQKSHDGRWACDFKLAVKK